MKPFLLAVLALFCSFNLSSTAAFCGFYVARADAELFNSVSKVVIVRDGDRTVVTMNNDFQGDVDEFAMVVPVPTLLDREQINVADPALIAHLDAFTAPRLVEYFDENPCRILHRVDEALLAPMMSYMAPSGRERRAKALGVTIEATYEVGEYDILILSAEQSEGLSTWLTENGYRLPAGASGILGSYIKQGLRFFIAKIDLTRQAKLGFSYLRPLQIAYESPRFMLPIRLGTLNARGKQELYVYALTRNGRVETRNYRTAKLPTGQELPASVKDDFGNFYRAMFTRQVEQNDHRVAMLEYAWDMGWCDPCAADPLNADELRRLGVFWIDGQGRGRVQNVFVTRLHLRYDSQGFPEDLMFIQTGDRTNFQGRYVIRHAWQGNAQCAEAKRYRTQSLPRRQQREAATLARLTGWALRDIAINTSPIEPDPWWRQLWPNR